MDEETFEIIRDLVAEEAKEGEFNATKFVATYKKRGRPALIHCSIRDAELVASKLSRNELEHLIKALVCFSTVVGVACSGGSATPVAPLWNQYAERYPESEPALTRWVVENRVNRYEPFGTVSFADATSLREHNELRRKRREKVALKERQREEDSRMRRAEDATKKLANAVRRGDIKAVEFLLAKGADPKKACDEAGSLQAIARENGRERMLRYLDEAGIK